MTAHRKNARGTLLLGLLLVATGVVFFAAPASGFAGWVMRLWPVFLICAGVARIMGYAVERKPRSPVGGMLLVFVGVLFLASRFHPDLHPIEVYGRYWMLLLVVFAAVELLRYYSHRQTYGPAPRLFTIGRLVIVVLIVSSGVVASRIARNPSLLSALHLRGILGGIRESVVGQTYAFYDAAITSSIPAGGQVRIENKYGNVKVSGGTEVVRVVLAKKINAWSEEDARNTSQQIRASIRQTEAGILITTNRDDIRGQYTTDIEVQIPPSESVSIFNSYGSVTATNVGAALTADVSYGDLRIERIGGDFLGRLNYSDLSATNIDGDVTATGFKRATIFDVDGSIQLSGRNGSVEARKIGGTVTIDAPLSRIIAQDLGSDADLKTEHGFIDVARAGQLTIEAPYSEVRVANIEGGAKISSSHGDIRVASVDGDLEIKSEQASVSAQDVTGQAVVQTSHGEVVLKGFHEGATVETSYRDVTLVPAGVPAGDILVNNNHGEIRLSLPSASQFQLEAVSQNGRINPVGFGGLSGRAGALTAVLGTDGPTIRLKTSYKNIVIQANGAGQAEAAAIVKDH